MGMMIQDSEAEIAHLEATIANNCIAPSQPTPKDVPEDEIEALTGLYMGDGEWMVTDVDLEYEDDVNVDGGEF